MNFKKNIKNLNIGLFYSFIVISHNLPVFINMIISLCFINMCIIIGYSLGFHIIPMHEYKDVFIWFYLVAKFTNVTKSILPNSKWSAGGKQHLKESTNLFTINLKKKKYWSHFIYYHILYREIHISMNHTENMIILASYVHTWDNIVNRNKKRKHKINTSAYNITLYEGDVNINIY